MPPILPVVGDAVVGACSACGDCCDPVWYPLGPADVRQSASTTGSEDLLFAAAHWVATGERREEMHAPKRKEVEPEQAECGECGDQSCKSRHESSGVRDGDVQKDQRSPVEPVFFAAFRSAPARTCALCALRLVLAISATFDPAGDTRTYPCISWCSAEQKSVQ